MRLRSFDSKVESMYLCALPKVEDRKCAGRKKNSAMPMRIRTPVVAPDCVESKPWVSPVIAEPLPAPAERKPIRYAVTFTYDVG
jgi:hypothetical protein